MPLDEAMQTQRAIGRIKSDPVDDALVLRILDPRTLRAMKAVDWAMPFTSTSTGIGRTRA